MLLKDCQPNNAIIKVSKIEDIMNILSTIKCSFLCYYNSSPNIDIGLPKMMLTKISVIEYYI